MAYYLLFAFISALLSLNFFAFRGREQLFRFVAGFWFWLGVGYLWHPAYTAALDWMSFLVPATVGMVVTGLIGVNAAHSSPHASLPREAIGSGVALLALLGLLVGQSLARDADFAAMTRSLHVRSAWRHYPPASDQHLIAVPQGVALATAQNAIGSYGTGYQITRMDIERWHGQLYWIGALDFRPGFFRWMSEKTAPGYIMVSAQNYNVAPRVVAGYHFRYTPNAYFGHNLYRHVQTAYPQYQLGSADLEITPRMQPYWVVSAYEKRWIGLVPQSVGAILVNPQTGVMRFVSGGRAPGWVTEINGSTYASLIARSYGNDLHGFFNTVFAHIGQFQPANVPEGVMGPGGQLYWYIALTSHSKSDQSALGFLMMNSRTGTMALYHLNGIQNPRAIVSRVNGSTNNPNIHADTPTFYNLDGSYAYIAPVVNNANKLEEYAVLDPTNASPPIVGSTLAGVLSGWQQYLANNGGNYQVTGGTVKYRTLSSVVARIAFNPAATAAEWLMTLKNHSAVFAVSAQTDPTAALIRPGDQITITYVAHQPTPVPVSKLVDHRLPS